MMFFIKPSQINVDFFTCNKAVFDVAKPKLATAFLPEWWKKLPKSRPNPLNVGAILTMKMCSGFSDLYASGLIQTMWSDLDIRIEPDGSYEYLFADGSSKIDDHSAHQFEGSPFSKNYTHLKIYNPWFFSSKQSEKMLFMPPIWNGFAIESICMPPGVIRLGKMPSPTNVNLFFKKEKQTVIHRIPFGLPLVQILPLSSKQIKPKYHLISKDEMHALEKENLVTRFFVNKFRKAEKLCSFSQRGLKAIKEVKRETLAT